MKRSHFGLMMCALVAFAGVEGCSWSEAPAGVYGADAESDESSDVMTPPEEATTPEETAPQEDIAPDDDAVPEEIAPPPSPAVELCDNGIDDDADGGVDCRDSDCDGQGSCKPAPPSSFPKHPQVDPHQDFGAHLQERTMAVVPQE